MKPLPQVATLLFLLVPFAGGSKGSHPVTIKISPTTASLALGGTQQFTVTVSGTSNKTVVWTETGGSITTTGLYTAPDTAGTYTVTVTSEANTSVSASATVTVAASGTTGVLDSAWVVLNRPGDGSNSEQENYQTANVTVSNDILTLTETHTTSTATGDYYQDDVPSGSYISCTSNGDNSYTCTAQYTSGAVQWATFNQSYGDFQISAKFGYGWPAIWMLGSGCQTTNITTPDNVGTCDWDAPGSSEIDIAEGDEVKAGSSSVGQNIYNSSLGDFNGGASGLSDITQNYHVYEVIITSSAVTFYVDGTQTATHSGNYNDHYFLIINNAIGGNLGGNPASYTYPNSTSVEWVKVCSSACTNGITGAAASNGTFFDNFTQP